MKAPTRLYEYIRDQDYIHVTVLGLNKASQDSHRFSKLVEYLDKYNCKKCLYDYRKGQFEIDVWTAYNRPHIAKKFNLPRDIKIAAVYQKITEDITFNETVFRNQGYSVRAFTDFQEATDWLKD